jgi:hypothetical protein
MKKPTRLEEKVLAAVLKELRRAMRAKRAVSFTIDPYVLGGGLYLFAAQTEAGHTYTIEEP